MRITSGVCDIVALAPGDRHRRIVPLVPPPDVDRSLLEKVHNPAEVFDRLNVNLFTFLACGQLRLPHHTLWGIGAGPGDQRRRPLAQQIGPDIRVAVVECGNVVVDLILTNPFFLQIKVE